MVFLPAAPTETPCHSWSLPRREGAAAGRGVTPPHAERWSCTAEGKTEPWVTDTKTGQRARTHHSFFSP